MWCKAQEQKCDMIQNVTKFILLTATLLVVKSVQAQDTHYWDSQYGTKGELLGGLVVGSATDLSSTFYNPGWIALQDGPSVLLTTKAAEIYSITLDDGKDRGFEPSSVVVTPSPGYLAGRFSLGDDWGWKWAYTYLQKVQFEYNASGLRIEQNPAPVGEENRWFSGEAFRDLRVDETWYGISLSRKLTDNVAIGFSPYIAHRSQRSRFQVMGLSLDATDVYSNVYLVDEYDYWHIRALLKMGVAAEWEKWSVGLAITTPSLSIVGDGSVYQNASFSGDYDPEHPGTEDPYLQADHQQDLDSYWKSPLSVAVGGARKFGDTRIHVTAEWFDAVSRFRVLDPVPYEVQSQPGDYDRYELEFAANNVLNYGLGIDHSFTDKFSLFTSYRVDDSITLDDIASNISMTVWDLNHVTGGASFQFLSMEFTAGLQYSWGSDSAHRFLSFDQDEDGDVNGNDSRHQVRYRRLKALLGFNLPFATTPSGG